MSTTDWGIAMHSGHNEAPWQSGFTIGRGYDYWCIGQGGANTLLYATTMTGNANNWWYAVVKVAQMQVWNRGMTSAEMEYTYNQSKERFV